jgi:hypothetical protein
MDLQKEREAFESWWEGFHNGRQITCDYVEEDNSYSVGYANAQWVAWQAKAQAVPEGFVLAPKEPTKEMISAGFNELIHGESEIAIYTAMIEAQEPKITELKIEWASDCFKCGHHEAIIYSTAAEASTMGWFHDGDEVKCTGCGNTGEMDARGEDSDICWNEDKAND